MLGVCLGCELVCLCVACVNDRDYVVRKRRTCKERKRTRRVLAMLRKRALGAAVAMLSLVVKQTER